MVNIRPKNVLKIAFVIIILVIIVFLNRLAIGSDELLDFMVRLGYGGIFVVSIASGFNLLVPIPVIGFFPLFIEAGFSAFALIVIISAGMLIGDMFGYFIGHVGKDYFKDKKTHTKTLQKLKALRKKHSVAPLIVLFFYAGFVPLPNELIVIPMAFMGYRLVTMMGVLFIGNVIFNMLVAFGFSIINSIF